MKVKKSTIVQVVIIIFLALIWWFLSSIIRRVFVIDTMDTLNINKEDAMFVLETWTCNFNYIWSYKYLDIYSWEFKTPSQYPTIDQYTKSINITWGIEEVKICILADVKQDHKWIWDYSFEIYAYLWSNIHKWYINVWRYEPTKQFFDGESWWKDKKLHGRFNGNETPFRQLIDLENVVIADVWWVSFYNNIRPIFNFQRGWKINIWAYVEWDNHFYAGRILQFRIIYKWSWVISK